MTAKVIRNPFNVDLPKSGPLDFSKTDFVMSKEQMQVFEDFSVIPVENPKRDVIDNPEEPSRESEKKRCKE